MDKPQNPLLPEHTPRADAIEKIATPIFKFFLLITMPLWGPIFLWYHTPTKKATQEYIQWQKDVLGYTDEQVHR
jgi:hypothetical protein